MRSGVCAKTTWRLPGGELGCGGRCSDEVMSPARVGIPVKTRPSRIELLWNEKLRSELEVDICTGSMKSVESSRQEVSPSQANRLGPVWVPIDGRRFEPPRHWKERGGNGARAVVPGNGTAIGRDGCSSCRELLPSGLASFEGSTTGPYCGLFFHSSETIVILRCLGRTVALNFPFPFPFPFPSHLEEILGQNLRALPVSLSQLNCP